MGNVSGLLESCSVASCIPSMQMDIEITQSFHSVLISGVPQFTPKSEDQARRFVDLIDEFYNPGLTRYFCAMRERAATR